MIRVAFFGFLAYGMSTFAEHAWRQHMILPAVITGMISAFLALWAAWIFGSLFRRKH